MGKLTEKDKERLRSVGYNREGYKTSKKRIVKDSRGSSQTEHFDGRVDAEIRPAPLKVTSKVKEN